MSETPILPMCALLISPTCFFNFPSSINYLIEWSFLFLDLRGNQAFIFWIITNFLSMCFFERERKSKASCLIISCSIHLVCFFSFKTTAFWKFLLDMKFSFCIFARHCSLDFTILLVSNKCNVKLRYDM